jgi:hypothetical protein
MILWYGEGWGLYRVGVWWRMSLKVGPEEEELAPGRVGSAAQAVRVIEAVMLLDCKR